MDEMETIRARDLEVLLNRGTQAWGPAAGEPFLGAQASARETLEAVVTTRW
ncbi:MAG: hypothetical protein ACREBE_02165 [bacterium]